ncbi:MAG: GTP cyclohydrolase FolE2 [Akkermansia sp.]
MGQTPVCLFLSAMQELKDTQSERDTRNISIDRVGVKGLKYPIVIKDKENREQSTVAIVSLAVDLPEEFKGTHMSRFVEVLQQNGPILDVHSAVDLPRELLRRLSASRSHVELEFPFFRKKLAPVTKIPGLMDYEVSFEIEAVKDRLDDFMLTVKVPVTTLCPCSKAMSHQGAHNQRGIVKYSVRFESKPIWIEDLIDLVEESASCSLYSVLKRPDEKWVTDHAYDNPVFVEDLVRNIAMRTEQHSAFRWYRIEAENFESIHNHQAYAVIERTLKKL